MIARESVCPMPDKAQATSGWWRLGLLGCLIVLLYASTLKGLWDIWWSRDTYAHGLLVPFISLYLVWRQRRLVQSLSQEPAIFLGLLGMTVSLAMLMVGQAGGIIALSGLSLIGMLASLVTVLFGLSSLRAYAFPIAYLIFMVPVLDVIIKPLQYPAQVVTATMATAILQSLGIPTFHEGISIHLPNVVAEVAPGCSGLNFLISILALGIPLAVVALQGMRNRLILIISGILIAILANWVRVALIGIHNYVWGGGLYGPFHLFQAIAVDWVGFIGLIAGTWVLTTLEAKRHASDRPTVSPPTDGIVFRWQPISTTAWILAVIVMLVGVAWEATYEYGSVEPAPDLALIPAGIGDWRAEPATTERPILALDVADQTLLRTYRHPQGRRVTVYVGYLGAQRQGRELVNFDARYDRLHRLAEQKQEMTSQGMFTYNQAAWVEKEDAASLLFWYAIDGRTYAGRYAAKWATVRQALAGRGSAGAFILLSAPRVKANNPDSDEWMAAFARSLQPFIRPAVHDGMSGTFSIRASSKR